MEENTSLFLEDEEDLRGVTLSAVDILQQKFAVKFRGYDVQDVDSFLEVVAKEFERLHSDGSRSSDELVALRREVDAYKKKEESINAALVTVQKMSDEMKVRASKEAESIIAGSRKKGEKIIQESQVKVLDQKKDMNNLRERAENEARKIIADARSESNKILAGIQEKRDGLHAEVSQLKEKAESQAHDIIEVARKESDALLADCRRKAESVRGEAEALKDHNAQEAHAITEKAHQDASHIIEDAQQKRESIQEGIATIKNRAEHEAVRIVDHAREEADKIKDAVFHEQSVMKETLHNLAQQKIQFQAELKTLVESHLKLLHSEDN